MDDKLLIDWINHQRNMITNPDYIDIEENDENDEFELGEGAQAQLQILDDLEGYING